MDINTYREQFFLVKKKYHELRNIIDIDTDRSGGSIAIKEGFLVKTYERVSIMRMIC